MSNELKRIDTAEIMSLGKVFKDSGFFTDIKSESQAVVKILAGRELGFEPMTSMMNIYIVNGRVALSANMMAGAIKNNPKYDYKILQLTESICQIEFYQDGKAVGISEFTLKDAKAAGTKNLDKFPRNMLFARAISNGCRWYCPDVFNGNAVYTPEELGNGNTETHDITIPDDEIIINAEDVLDPEPETKPKPEVKQINPSQYSLAQKVHISANGAGITEGGVRAWLQYKYKVISAKELTDEQAIETIQTFSNWNKTQVENCNKRGNLWKAEHCSKNPNTCGNDYADGDVPYCSLDNTECEYIAE